jgi:hypothetical protein
MIKFIQKLGNSLQSQVQQIVLGNPILKNKIPQGERISYYLSTYINRLKNKPIFNNQNVNKTEEVIEEEPEGETTRQWIIKWGIRVIAAAVLFNAGLSIYNNWYT